MLITIRGCLGDKNRKSAVLVTFTFKPNSFNQPIIALILFCIKRMAVCLFLCHVSAKLLSAKFERLVMSKRGDTSIAYRTQPRIDPWLVP